MIVIRPGDLGPVLRGIDETIAGIERAAHDALEWYGQEATAQMKADHDRDAHEIQRYVNRTFYLTTTIGYDVQHPNSRVTRLLLVAPPWYAEAVEFGTPYSRAYPFFWPAIYDLQGGAMEHLDTAFNTAIIGTVGRTA